MVSPTPLNRLDDVTNVCYKKIMRWPNDKVLYWYEWDDTVVTMNSEGFVSEHMNLHFIEVIFGVGGKPYAFVNWDHRPYLFYDEEQAIDFVLKHLPESLKKGAL